MVINTRKTIDRACFHYSFLKLTCYIQYTNYEYYIYFILVSQSTLFVLQFCKRKWYGIMFGYSYYSLCGYSTSILYVPYNLSSTRQLQLVYKNQFLSNDIKAYIKPHNNNIPNNRYNHSYIQDVYNSHIKNRFPSRQYKRLQYVRQSYNVNQIQAIFLPRVIIAYNYVLQLQLNTSHLQLVRIQCFLIRYHHSQQLCKTRKKIPYNRISIFIYESFTTCVQKVKNKLLRYSNTFIQVLAFHERYSRQICIRQNQYTNKYNKSLDNLLSTPITIYLKISCQIPQISPTPYPPLTPTLTPHTHPSPLPLPPYPPFIFTCKGKKPILIGILIITTDLQILVLQRLYLNFVVYQKKQIRFSKDTYD
eukprot:TRINITY_DN7534_c0_g1_i1.p1 TRINITY_DN7534_c0_g1~~TRINITY_DN7534_c0_g1_i1.p1  ORF type:complete len:362 (-),score=-26.05 TRINITY_DN7534_c0_g1_i1:21-1106(-)